MVWVKGKSGNPGGRPPRNWGNTAKERAMKHMDASFKALADIVKDKEAPHAARVAAASNLLDRAYGKAPQDVTVRGQVEHHIIKLIQGLDVRDVIDIEDQPELPPPVNGEAQDT